MWVSLKVATDFYPSWRSFSADIGHWVSLESGSRSILSDFKFLKWLRQFVSNATSKGGIIAAANLNAWMKKTFTAYTKFSGAQGGKNGRNFPTLLSGKKGIYIIIPNCSAYFAPGHVDVWNGTDCNGGCYFNIEGGLPGNRK